MSDGNSQVDAQPEGMEADAVCVICGNVNPEGTLLCKNCGNNLRDQRKQRIQKGAAVLPAAIALPRRGLLLRAGLSVLVLLVFVWVAVNISTIEQWMLKASTAESQNANALWKGNTGKLYDRLQQELKRKPVTSDEMQQAVAKPVNSADYTGRYFFQYNNRLRESVGSAYVLQQGAMLYFVAELPMGIELRGEAKFEGTDQRPTARRSAAVKIGKDYYMASGFAQRGGDNTLTCTGLTVADAQRTYEVKVYRVP